MSNTEHSTTSVSLLERVQQQDEESWHRLVKIYSPLISYWCVQQHGLSPEVSAEIVQEVFLSVHQSIAEFHRYGTGSFRSWLRTITANKVIDRFRQESGCVEPIGGSNWQQTLQSISSPDSSRITPVEQELILQAAMEVLGKKFKETNCQAFWMVLLEGLTAAETAEKLGIREAAVWQACYRIRKRLREELADVHDDLFPGKSERKQ